MRNFDLGLEKYGIGKFRYRELRYFCLQYPGWKDELKYNTSTLKSPKLTGMPRGGVAGKETEELAIRRVHLQHACDTVEIAAQEADSEIAEYIIKHVTQEYAGYTHLRERMGMPAGKKKFYKARRNFFEILNKKWNA